MLDMLYYLDLHVVFPNDKPGDWGSHLVTGGGAPSHQSQGMADLRCFLGNLIRFCPRKGCGKGSLNAAILWVYRQPLLCREPSDLKQVWGLALFIVGFDRGWLIGKIYPLAIKHDHFF